MYVSFIFFISILGLVGYGAYSLLSNPAHYAEEVWEKTRNTENTQTEEVVTLDSKNSPEKNDTPTQESPKTDTTPEPTTTTSTGNLATKIDGLISRNITLKQGNRGSDVGVIQEFMNQYYKRNDRIDNDFGPNLTTLVKKFQGSQKLPTTGQIGPKTLAVMKNLAK